MIFESVPLITCTCVTKDRPQLLKKAIDYYVYQTYPNKNLVIVSQGSEESNKENEFYVQSLQRSDILFIKAPSSLSLGSMRNVSVELATGEIICQWDDDDIYHPDRIKNQYQELRCDNRNIAAVYCDFLKYFLNSGELYWCNWHNEPKLNHQFLCGSVMFYKKAFHMYPMFYPEYGGQSIVEEDLNVLEKLIYKGSIAPVSSGIDYIYVYHGINTYDLEHHKLTLNTSWGKKVYSINELLEKKFLLEANFSLMGLKEKIAVRSLEGTAFIYEPEGVGCEV